MPEGGNRDWDVVGGTEARTSYRATADTIRNILAQKDHPMIPPNRPSCKGLSEQSTSRRRPGGDLLVFRGPDGSARAVRAVDDWLRRRSEILEGFRSVVGPLPGPEKRGPLDPRSEGEVDCGTYVRRSVTYASEPGSRVP